MTTPTAGQWIHDRAQLEALPAGSWISDKFGDDHQRDSDRDWQEPGSGIYYSSGTIFLPAYLWRVGPAPTWRGGIVDGDR